MDANDDVVSRYETVQSKGLYYIQNLQVVTVPDSTTTDAINHLDVTTIPPDPDDDCTVQTSNPSTHMDSIDFELPLHIEDAPAQFAPRTNLYCQAINTAVTTVSINRMGASTMEKDVLNFETWHQRTGHCSEKRLRKTQQLVDGIPAFRTATLPHVINCRTCDVAKLKKAPRGPPTIQPATLQLGQSFQMDIGFIRGPSNLAAVLARTEEAQPKVIESRQGYTCYLLVIETKSRYMWTFPLKSKSLYR